MTYLGLKRKELQGDFVTMFRCPFDRAVSIYRYFQQATDVDFTATSPDRRDHLCQNWWIKGGEVGKDIHLYDFGDFENEVSRMAKDFGLNRKKSGLHTKKTKRKTAQEELSPKAIRRIAEFYAPDIKVMEKAGFPFTVDF